jgi:hypothetical protein
LIFIAAVRDESSLRETIKKRLGVGARSVRVGDAEMTVSADSELGAASVFESHVILGSEQGVRRCLEARASGKTFAATDAFKKPLSFAGQTSSPIALTLTDDRAQALRFISLVARGRGDGSDAPDATKLARSAGSLPYAISITKLATDGLERKTFSPFGQFAAIALQLSPDAGAVK